MNWNKTEINFGESQFNEVKTETIDYLGNQSLSNSNFLTSCGCTSPSYDATTKKLTIGLRMTSKGIKTASVTVNYPDGTQDILILKANIL